MKNNLCFEDFLKYCDDQGLVWHEGNLKIKVFKSNLGLRYLCHLSREIAGILVYNQNNGWYTEVHPEVSHKVYASAYTAFRAEIIR